MIAAFLRILIGFAAACLAAAITQVLFVITPADLFELDGDARMQRMGFAWLVALSAATQSGIFAAPFALVAIGFGAFQRLRGWPYYVFVGIIIALAGFVVLYTGENSGQPTIANGYAVAAFVFSGIIGGYVYWIIAGRRAGGNYQPIEVPRPEEPEAPISREHLKVKNSELRDDLPAPKVRVSTADGGRLGSMQGKGKPH